MKQHSQIKTAYFLPFRTITVLVVILSVISGMASVSKNKPDFTNNDTLSEVSKNDSIKSVKAFMQVYTVLMSPRCMNCHPSGDVPLQGDDSQLHTMSPQRGQDGKGVFAMKCTNCHQPTNTPGLHTPPGNTNWHLPPSEMKMVFQGKTPHQLARQLVDPAQNGHKNKKQLIEHAMDDLVLAGWNPGEGRSLPPISHQEFKKAWTTWLEKGAYAPASK
ncbi:MAG: hypothetical protein LH618_05975 [Saprospiraceae bacterium]|nr:hypothetical protein [Saprospiraceae bacterium]